MRIHLRLALLTLLAAWWWPRPGSAGDFNALGEYVVDPEAVAFVGFGDDFDPIEDRYVPADTSADCLPPAFEQVEAADALVDGALIHVNAYAANGCGERFVVSLPATAASYRATVWMRHGAVDAQLTVKYPDDSGRDIVIAKMFPSGRVTSDGWVELASNDFPVDGAAVEKVYIRIVDMDSVGSDIDALEIVPAPSSPYWESQPCSGAGDPVCGSGAECIYNRCRLGRLNVPPLPADAIRHAVVDAMQSQLRSFFGGRKTRLEDLPQALAKLDEIRWAETAWEFWSGWGAAIRRLHDWHTNAYVYEGGASRTRRLNVCFFEGDADVSQQIWPKHPYFKDILVSHTGSEGTHGIAQGDRLVAVDGLHPLEWALGLVDQSWGFWWASDSAVFSEIAESLRGLILAHAESFTVIHCHAATGTCDPTVEVITVSELPEDDGGHVHCDNRPFYHLQGDNNPNANHNVGWSFFRGAIEGTTPEEAIFGMVWDTLYGAGDPNGYVNSNLSAAIADWKQNARGVILDHRAGSGGTLDAAENLTRLVRPSERLLVFYSPIEVAGFDGPETVAEGIALFDKLKSSAAMIVGSPVHDPDLPVALITHRAGSASDFMPFGMKGAPKVRLFAPEPTAGAFSTYYYFSYWGSMAHQLASGDSISKDGQALLGHGVAPDEVVLPRQSDLLAGLDTLHEAALAWVRQELKP